MQKLLIKLLQLVACALFLVIAAGALVRYEMTRPIGVAGDGLLSHMASSAVWLAELPFTLYHGLLSPSKFNLMVPDRFPGHTGFVGDPNDEEGYLLLSRADGNTGKGIVELIDLRTFEVQHTWIPDLVAIVDEWNERAQELSDSPQFIEPYELVYHPMMVSNGLVFNAAYSTMRKVDNCSRLVWQNTPAPHDTYHHSIEVDIDGHIWSLGEHERLHPAVKDGLAGKPFTDNRIIKLNSDGEVLFTKSIADILRENDLEYLLWGIKQSTYSIDWVHSNDLQPAHSDTKYWKKGDVLISIHTASLVLLYRPSTNQLIWHSLGYTNAQHDTDFIDDSKISIFDNNTAFKVQKPRFPINDRVVDETVWSDGHSQVIVYDFATQKYSSYFDEALSVHEVRTPSQGRSEILPNGELFVEETDSGRTLYFNADGSLRWSHVNRAEDGNVYIVAWSRMLYRDHEIAMVRDFLENKDERLATCNVSKPMSSLSQVSLSDTQPRQ